MGKKEYLKETKYNQKCKKLREKNNIFILIVISIILLIPTKIFANEKYTITFNANGGYYENNEMEYIIETENLENFKNIEYPIKKGYQFIGYYTENDITIDEYINQKEISNNLIFYARWEQIQKRNLKKIIIIISAMLVLIGYFYIVIFNKKDD